jgi:toxic protein SymE
MAEADLKPSTQLAERSVTVQQSPRYQPLERFKPGARRSSPPLAPWFKLSGRWLELAGFDPGQRLKVEVQLGRLVITHA